MNRSDILAASANAMRRVLIDYARKHRNQQSQRQAISLEDPQDLFDQKIIDCLTLDSALEKLAEKSARKVKLVELRFFCGLTIDECSSALGIHRSVVVQDWAFTRAWLHREMSLGSHERNRE